MTIQPASVSVTIPVSQAVDRVKRLLFRPFDLHKWIVIGFCAWLAQLGDPGFRFNYTGGSRRRGGPSIREAYEHARAYVMDNLSWIVPLAIVLVVFFIALWVVMLWVSSRGRFMFLHCVVLDKAEVGVPWNKFSGQGHSLFLFRLVLGLIGMVPTLPLMAVAMVMVIRMINQGKPDLHSILVLIGLVLMIFAVSAVFLVVSKLTTDFVVPIMFLRGNKCVEAWRELLGLISVNVANFAVYLLFQILLAMATGALVLMAILITCCIAGCLMIIPYLGTVLLLPVLMFKRSYSLYYFAQYGREYDVFPVITAPPLAPAA